MSNFTLYPAIDLRGGKAVRLTQGRADQQTVYGDDPPAIARDFASRGARWLHVINLDGAFGDDSRNLEILRAICASVSVPVQFGGGLRREADVDLALQAGAKRVILGTTALREPQLVRTLARRLGERLAVGIDAKGGKVAVSGWVEVSETTSLELARRMIDAGVNRFVYTDISRDGMLVGPDLDGARAIGRLGAHVIASGGVGDLTHVRAAAGANDGVDGLIVGKALYEARFTLNEALAAVNAPKGN
ncbi:MAG: 1-(5-phosphoribosyl)-5-[(5-phosphoribosylamino)methylideneamino]imidazole-4-carboxamide isomerase [Planctomycetes bacterium]|nr:1-(5-phosphoribosyl)-5-[(5-phosphoribosylamino)methylideneamino]imidazole-4-carboxamide isomerase [Planctomycetota bacterium]